MARLRCKARTFDENYTLILHVIYNRPRVLRRYTVSCWNGQDTNPLVALSRNRDIVIQPYHITVVLHIILGFHATCLG